MEEEGLHHWSRKDRKPVSAESSDNFMLTIKEAGWKIWNMVNLGPMLFKYNEIFARKKHIYFSFFFLPHTLEQRTEHPWRCTWDIQPFSKYLSLLFSINYGMSLWKLVGRTTFIRLENILLPSPTQEQNWKIGEQKEKILEIVEISSLSFTPRDALFTAIEIAKSLSDNACNTSHLPSVFYDIVMHWLDLLRTVF